MKDNKNLVFTVLKQNKWIFAIVIVSWLIFIFIILGLTNTALAINIEKIGLFGDSFNVLTSLFTGLAFSGVVVSIILQIEELKAVRSEMEGQKKALEEQRKEMKIQSFNNKFFQMLNLFSNIVDNLSIPFIRPNSLGDKTKKNALKYIKEDKLLAIKSYLSAYNNTEYTDEYLNKDNYMVRFKEVNDEFDNTFKYYFINLYQVLNYTDKSHTNIDDAKQYTNIIRAQLSKDELVLLFYNAIGVKEFSGDKYKNIVEKYSFFEHLQYKDLCHHEMIETANSIFKDSVENKKIGESNGHFLLINSLIKTYDKKAFGKNNNMLMFKEIIDKDKNIESFIS